MIQAFRGRSFHAVRTSIHLFICFSFLFTLVVPNPSFAATVTQFQLPVSSSLLTTTPEFKPVHIRALTVYPDNPFLFDFLVDKGDTQLTDENLKNEYMRIIKYFMASLTIPEKDMWVNLSPYEKDRIIPASFGQTEMGRDLLAQDYVLKQMTSSLMSPEGEAGKKFWDRVYQRAYERFGTNTLPIDTFNKVWIIPQEVVVIQDGMTAFVAKSSLKVLLEGDYDAMKQSQKSSDEWLSVLQKAEKSTDVNDIGSQIIREIVVPEIEQEVNYGRNFANFRQIFNSLILAKWYKVNLKETLLGQMYVDRAKTKGVNVDDPDVNTKIWEKYVEAFKAGVYDYIKEDYDPATNEVVAKKYFSGGTVMAIGENIFSTVGIKDAPEGAQTLDLASLVKITSGVETQDGQPLFEAPSAGDVSQAMLATQPAEFKERAGNGKGLLYLFSKTQNKLIHFRTRRLTNREMSSDVFKKLGRSRDFIPANIRVITRDDMTAAEEIYGYNDESSEVLFIREDAFRWMKSVDDYKNFAAAIRAGKTSESSVIQAMIKDDKTLGYNRLARRFYAGAKVSGQRSNQTIDVGEQLEQGAVKQLVDLFGSKKIGTKFRVITTNSYDVPVGVVLNPDADGVRMPFVSGEAGQSVEVFNPSDIPDATVVAAPFMDSRKVNLRHVSVTIPANVNTLDVKSLTDNWFKGLPKEDLSAEPLFKSGQVHELLPVYHPEQKILGYIDSTRISINRFTVVNERGVEETYVQMDFNLWYPTSDVFVNYDLDRKFIADAGLQYASGVPHQTSPFVAPKVSPGKTPKIAIMGAGRITGVVLMRLLEDFGPNIEIGFINGGTAKRLHTFLMSDSIYGRFIDRNRGDRILLNEAENILEITYAGKTHRIKFFDERDFSRVKDLPYREYGINIVIDAVTSRTNAEMQQYRIGMGGGDVINTAPSKIDAEGKPLTMIAGVNDLEFAYGNANSDQHIISNASCTTCSVAPIIYAMANGESRIDREIGEAEYARAARVTQDAEWAKTALQSSGIEVKTIYVNTNHAFTQSDTPLDSRDQPSLASMRTQKTGAADALALALGLNKENTGGHATRNSLPDVSITSTDMVIELTDADERVSAEAMRERILKELVWAATSERATFDVQRGISSHNQVAQTTHSGIMREESLVVQRIPGTKNAFHVHFESWYDNEFSYGDRIVNAVEIIVSRRELEKAKDQDALLRNLDQNAVRYSPKLNRFTAGAAHNLDEQILKAPGGTLEYLAWEAGYNPDTQVRQLARKIILDIVTDMNIHPVSLDYHQRVGQESGQTMVEPTVFAASPVLGALKDSISVIAQTAIKHQVFPDIVLNGAPTTYSKRKPAQKPETEAVRLHDLPSPGNMEPVYTEASAAIALAGLMQNGYTGSVALRRTFVLDPVNFAPYYEEARGKVENPVDAAIEQMRSEIVQAVDAGIYNLDITLGASVLSETQVNLLKGSVLQTQKKELMDAFLGRLLQKHSELSNVVWNETNLNLWFNHLVLFDAFGSEYLNRLIQEQDSDVETSAENFGQGLMSPEIADAIEESADQIRKELETVKALYASVYETLAEMIVRLTILVRNLEKEKQFNRSHLELNFDVSEHVDNVFGAIHLRKALQSQGSRRLADYVMPTSIMYQRPTDKAMLGDNVADLQMNLANQFLGQDNRRGIGHVVNIGFADDHDAQAASVANAVLKAIANKAAEGHPAARGLEAFMIAVMDGVSIISDEQRPTPGVAVAIDSQVKLVADVKIKALGLNSKRGSRRFARARSVWLKAWENGYKKNLTVEEIGRRLLTGEDLNGLVDSKSLGDIDYLRDHALTVFGAEIWNLYEEQGRADFEAALAEIYANVQGANTKTAVETILAAPDGVNRGFTPSHAIGIVSNNYDQRAAQGGSGENVAVTTGVIPSALEQKISKAPILFSKKDILPVPELSADVKALFENFGDIIRLKNNGIEVEPRYGIEPVIKGKMNANQQQRFMHLYREGMYNPNVAVQETVWWIFLALSEFKGIPQFDINRYYAEQPEAVAKDPSKNFTLSMNNNRAGGVLFAKTGADFANQFDALVGHEEATSEKSYGGLATNTQFVMASHAGHFIAENDGPVIVQADHRQIAPDSIYKLDAKKVPMRYKNNYIGSDAKVFQPYFDAMTLEEKEEYVNQEARQAELDKHFKEIQDFVLRGGNSVDFDISTVMDTVLADEIIYRPSRTLDNPNGLSKTMNQTDKLLYGISEKRLKPKKFAEWAAQINMSVEDAEKYLLDQYQKLGEEKFVAQYQNAKYIEITPVLPKSMKDVAEFWKAEYKRLGHAGFIQEWTEADRVEKYKRAHAASARFSAQQLLKLRIWEAEMKKAGLLDPEQGFVVLTGFEERHTDHSNNPTEIEGTMAIKALVDAELGKYQDQFRRKYGYDLIGFNKISEQTGSKHGQANLVTNVIPFLLDQMVLKMATAQHGTSKLSKDQYPNIAAAATTEAHFATNPMNLAFKSLLESFDAMPYVLWDLTIFLTLPLEQKVRNNIPKTLQAYLQMVGMSEDWLLTYARTYHAKVEKFGQMKSVKGYDGLSEIGRYLLVHYQNQNLTLDKNLPEIILKIASDDESVDPTVRSKLKDLVKFWGHVLHPLYDRLPPEARANYQKNVQGWMNEYFPILGAQGSLKLAKPYYTGRKVWLPPAPESMTAGLGLPRDVRPQVEMGDYAESLKAFGLSSEKKNGKDWDEASLVTRRDVSVETGDSHSIVKPDNTGGIDVSNFGVKIIKTDNGIPVPLNQQSDVIRNVDVFTPVIIKIQPATFASFPLLSKLMKTDSDAEKDSAGNSDEPQTPSADQRWRGLKDNLARMES